MSRPPVREERFLLVPVLSLLLLLAVLAWVLPLTAGNRIALLLLISLSLAVTTLISYRASKIGLRRQYPSAPLLILFFNLAEVYILHNYFPAIDLLMFVTVAGTGVFWGLRPGLDVGLTAAAGYTLVLMVIEPFSAHNFLSLAVYDLHLIFVGWVTGLLATRELRRRAELAVMSAQNAELARELKAANAELEDRVAVSTSQLGQEQQQKEELYEMILHDLKSPLGTMLSALQLLREEFPPESAQAHQALSAALNAGVRQTELIENLLDVQRLRAGALPLNLESVDLGPILQTLVEQLKPRIQRKTIQLETAFADTLPSVRVDKYLISRVISNLLENAYKFTPPHGRIAVGAQIQDGGLHVTVADNGPGVPSPLRQAIFEKYRKLQVAGTEAQNGAGLGLTFCKMALEAQGGEITVYASPSNGAQFEFILPLEKASSPALV